MDINNAAHSVLSYALFESINDIISANQTESSEAGASFIDAQGNIYIPFNISTDPNQTNIPFFAKNDRGTTGDRISFQSFKSEFLDDNITTLRYNQSISLRVLLKQLSADRGTYGCLLKAGNFVINPMHPMVAFLIAAKLIEIPAEGELHIFPFSESGVRRMPTSETTAMTKYKDNFKKFFALAPNIIIDEQKVRMEPSIDSMALENLSEKPLWSELSRVNVRVRRTVTSSGDKPEGLIVPLQMAVDGLLTPYYGVANVDAPTADVRGFSCSPMVTGNINASTSNQLDRSSHNVCTGDENSSRKSGWLTLSRVNLNSMYFNGIVASNDVFEFIEASKQISHDIWSTLADAEAAERAQGASEVEATAAAS